MFIVRGGSGTAYVAGIWLASTIDALRVVVQLVGAPSVGLHNFEVVCEGEDAGV